MNRQARMLVIIGMMAIVGVSALAFMANRYAKLNPTKSVMDVVPEAAAEAPGITRRPVPVQAPVPAPVAELPEEPVERSQAPAEEPATPPAAEAVVEQQPEQEQEEDPLADFLEIRRAVVAVFAEQPGLTSRMKRRLSGEAWSAPSKVDFKLALDVRFVRDEKLAETGYPAEEYGRVREAFVAWMEGRDPADAELAALFESRRDELEGFYLGDLEVLDGGGLTGGEAMGRERD